MNAPSHPQRPEAEAPKTRAAREPRPPRTLDRLPVDQLHRPLGLTVPLEYPTASRNKPLTEWRMEEDDAPIFRYLYRHLRPRRHLEIGTWQGQGAIYCLEECAATVWTVNLPFGESLNGSAAYGHHPAEHAAIRSWARRIGLPDQASYRTDTLGFIGRLYLERGLGHRVHQVYADSLAWDTQNLPPGFFDTILIDGGHAREVVLSDTRKALPLLRPGGVILWHDFCPPAHEQCGSTRGVHEAVAELLPELRTALDCLFWIQPSWILVGIKEPAPRGTVGIAPPPFEPMELDLPAPQSSPAVPAPPPEARRDNLKLEIAHRLDRAEPLSDVDLAEAEQALETILRQRDLAAYLATNRSRIPESVGPLALYRSAEPGAGVDEALARDLRSIYFELTLA
jgi:predicted O-methyltransferase YrrM